MAVDVCALYIYMSLLCCVYASGIKLPQVVMDEQCERRLAVGEPFVLTLTEQLYYHPQMECPLTLQAKPGHRIMLHFLYLHIHTNDMEKGCEDFVRLNETQSIFSHSTLVICRTKKSMVTTNTTVSIQFHSNARGQDRGFQLLVTPFHTGDCHSGEYRCNNGRCIDSNMYCNNYNNCGDNSDYCISSDKDYSGTVYMVAAIILCVVLLIVIISMCCCCAKTSRKRRRRRRSRSVRHLRQHTRELREAYDNPVGLFSLNDLPPYMDMPSYPPPAYSTFPRRHALSQSSVTTTETSIDWTTVPVEHPQEGTPRIPRDSPVEETGTPGNTPEEGKKTPRDTPVEETSTHGNTPEVPLDAPVEETGTPGNTPEEGTRIPRDTPVEETSTPGNTPQEGDKHICLHD